MNLKARIYVENQKRNGEAKLEARLAYLREKELDPGSIQRDATLRKIKALVRKADFRLARIAAQENLNQERAQAKVERLAAEKAAQKAEPRRPLGPRRANLMDQRGRATVQPPAQPWSFLGVSVSRRWIFISLRIVV